MTATTRGQHSQPGRAGRPTDSPGWVDETNTARHRRQSGTSESNATSDFRMTLRWSHRGGSKVSACCPLAASRDQVRRCSAGRYAHAPRCPLRLHAGASATTVPPVGSARADAVRRCQVGRPATTGSGRAPQDRDPNSTGRPTASRASGSGRSAISGRQAGAGPPGGRRSECGSGKVSLHLDTERRDGRNTVPTAANPHVRPVSR